VAKDGANRAAGFIKSNITIEGGRSERLSIKKATTMEDDIKRKETMEK